MRAIIYARVSTEDQDCTRQVNELTEYAKRCGHDVIAVMQEKASGAKNDRKERAAVMALARKRQVDVILVSELSRWGRSTIDLLDTLKELASYKVSVCALSGMQFDLATKEGELMATLFGGFAQFERALLQERVKSGLANAKSKGKVLGRKVGFKPSDKYKKQVLEFLAAGKTYRWIEDELHISKNTVMKIAKEAV